MSETRTEIRPGAYFDSVVLMQLQRALVGLPGVQDAGVVMATPANTELLVEAGLYPEEAHVARPDDLLIVVRAEGADEAEAALGQVDTLIAARRSTSAAQGFRPRSLDTALKALPDAGWLLISVPGRYAAGLARQGLDRDLNIFLYSDNVSLEEEIELKQTARARGLLVMGPDCGTALIGGIGLGFANRVRRGSIGLVGASGTGLQAITSAVHTLGGGVSHAIGTGGRDLKAEVGGITALQGLEALAADEETGVIILVSKPPAPQTAARLLGAAQRCGKPVVVNFIGYPAAFPRIGNVHFAANLHQAAQLAVAQTGGQDVLEPVREPGRGYLRGLFSGGTLAVEAVLALQNAIYPLYTNVPIAPHQALENPLHSQAHTVVDLGEDQFTQGRLHPMMDNDLRIRRMRQEVEDPDTGVIWLDVVLGEGAHPDPASELAPVIEAIPAAAQIRTVVLIVGTPEDPQDLESQAARFREAGADVFTSMEAAVEHLAAYFSVPGEAGGAPPATGGLRSPFQAINAGLEIFYESLSAQGAEAVHMEWRPPAGGDEKMAALLARLKG